MTTAIAIDPWMVWRTRPQRTLTLFRLLQNHPELDGWTPVRIEGAQRRPMIPGLCFAPLRLLDRIDWEAKSRGIWDAKPLLFNDNIMLFEEAELAGLRRSEELENAAPGFRAEEIAKLRVGMEVLILNRWVEDICGIIKRLDAEYAHLDVDGLNGRVRIARHMLRPKAIA